MFSRISQLSLTSIALVLSTGLASLAQTATVQRMSKVDNDLRASIASGSS